MRITDTRLRNIVRNEIKRNIVKEASSSRIARVKQNLKFKYQKETKKGGKDAGVKAAMTHVEKLRDVTDEQRETLRKHVNDLGGVESVASVSAAEDVPEDAPEKKEKVLVHSPTRDGGPSDPRIATAGHGKEAEVFTVGADGQSISYTDAMKDILAGKKMLKAGQGGDAFKTSEDEAKKTIWRQIKIIQGLLISAGYAKGLFSKPTGYFGSKTKSAVLKMQTALKLARDGIVGRQTAAAFNPKVTGSKVPITGKDVSDAIERVINELPPASVQKESIRRWRNSRLRRDPSKVRVTRRQLRRAIREEFSSVTEQSLALPPRAPPPLFDDPIQTAKEEFSRNDNLNMKVTARWVKINKERGGVFGNKVAANVTVKNGRVTDWEMLEEESSSTKKTTDTVIGSMKGETLTNVPDGTYQVSRTHT